MAEFETLAGTVISVSAGLPATYDQVGYEALTFTTIGLVETSPEMGKVYELATFKPLGTRGTLKAKGSYDNGGGDLIYAIKKTDAGQGLMETASESDNSHSFKFTSSNGRVRYVTGMVMSARESGGGSADIEKQTSNVEFDSDIVAIAAP